MAKARIRKPPVDLRTENRMKKRAARVARNLDRTIANRREEAKELARKILKDDTVPLTPDIQERLGLGLAMKKHEPRFTIMSSEEKAIAIELFHEGLSRHKIAAVLHREISTIVRFIQRYQSTTTASRMYFEANADKLAHRVVKNANVDQSLEVLDRLDVLPAKDRKGGGGDGGPRFNVMIGVPGATIPIPTQREIEASRTPTVEVEGSKA